jgi:hypothetical protein
LEFFAAFLKRRTFGPKTGHSGIRAKKRPFSINSYFACRMAAWMYCVSINSRAEGIV